jgi:hypothetical protein
MATCALALEENAGFSDSDRDMARCDSPVCAGGAGVARPEDFADALEWAFLGLFAQRAFARSALYSSDSLRTFEKK